MFIRFSSERSPDLGSVSLSEATESHEISKDPQKRVREGLTSAGTCVGLGQYLAGKYE